MNYLFQLNDTDMLTIKEHFLNTYDENGDGKIDIKEVINNEKNEGTLNVQLEIYIFDHHFF